MTPDGTLEPIPALNPTLLTLARHAVARMAGAEKTAVIPGGDPAAAGGAPPAGPPPGMPPGGDPSAGGGAAMPPGGGGDMVGQVAQQVMQMQQQAGGGPMGKGKSPKDQIQQGQMKILMNLVAQMASKMGIQVDPQLLVPATDPSTDQVAMQEMQGASMAPSNDPNAPQGGAAGGGAPPPAGPPGVTPMDATQGPIGKAAEVGFAMGSEFPAGMGAGLPEIDAIIAGAQATASLAARTRQALGLR